MELLSRNISYGLHLNAFPCSSLPISPRRVLIHPSGTLISVTAMKGTSPDCPALLASKAYTCGPISSVQFSRSVVSDSVIPWTAARQASLSITNSRSPLKPMSIESVMPSNRLILCRPLLLLSSICSSIRVFSNESTLCIRGQSIGVSASTSVLPMNTQDWSLGWTGWISCSSRDSQESSPTPQFKSINSLVLSFFYSPTLTSIHDYWENHSLD